VDEYDASSERDPGVCSLKITLVQLTRWWSSIR
jgi:hypothetical protein